MSELSVVEETRIYEYQHALRLLAARPDSRQFQAGVDEAKEKLEALGIEPGIARYIRVDVEKIRGER